jgi:hypothetical protein
MKESEKTQTGSVSFSSQSQKHIAPKEIIMLFGLSSNLGSQGEDIIGCLNAVTLDMVEDATSEFPVLDSLKTNDNPVIFRFKFKSI